MRDELFFSLSLGTAVLTVAHLKGKVGGTSPLIAQWSDVLGDLVISDVRQTQIL